MAKDSKNRALSNKKEPYKQAWRRKDFHKDTRDSFMKKLDQQRAERER